MSTPLTHHAHIRIPVIGGAMYPCSNPELVAAVSAAGGIGVFQPISLTFVHGHKYRDGLRLMMRLSGGAPIGMNALIEASSRSYHERMLKWVDIALEEGVRFFVTSLGNPRWVVERARSVGGVVYHDVTEAKWAQKGADAGVHGLIGVNDRAGGHVGSRSVEGLFDELAPFGLPVICAGGVGSADGLVQALRIGYAGVQLGTRLIATTECSAHERYKQAIVEAVESDITRTERLTGVPVSVIRTPYIERMGTTVGHFARYLFKGRRTKRWIRTWYGLRSLASLKRSNSRANAERDYWQAGCSVADIHSIEPVATIMATFEAAAESFARSVSPA